MSEQARILEEQNHRFEEKLERRDAGARWWNPLSWFRSSTHTVRPSSPAAFSLFALGSTTAGIFVNSTTAMQCSAWWSGIRLLSDSTAMLPARLVEDTGEEIRPAMTHPVNRLLRRPWAPVTRFTFFQTLMNHVLAKGNFYGEILSNGVGQAGGIAIMDPDDIEPEWTPDGNAKLYRSKKDSSQVWEAPRVIHVSGLGFDGLKGYNVVDFAKQSIGLDLAAEGYGASWFGSGGRPAGTLTHPGKLSPETSERMTAEWKRKHAPGMHEVAILQEGLTFAPEDNDPAKAQAIETRRMQLAVVARFLRVPPHMLYDLDRANFANIEAMGQEFLTFSLAPWLTAIEEEFEAKLLSEDEQDTHSINFDTEYLLRGDSLKSSQKRCGEVNAGLMSPAEARRQMNLSYIKGTEKLRVPLNFGTLQQDGTVDNNGAANGNVAGGTEGTGEQRGYDPAQARDENGRWGDGGSVAALKTMHDSHPSTWAGGYGAIDSHVDVVATLPHAEVKAAVQHILGRDLAVTGGKGKLVEAMRTTFKNRLASHERNQFRSDQRGGPGSGPQHQSADTKSQALSDKFKQLPATVAAYAMAKVKEKYAALESRYGRVMAVSILVAGILGLPMPVPGSSLIMAAPLLAAGELYRLASGNRSEHPEFTYEEITQIGVEWLQGMLDEWQKENHDAAA